MMTVRLRFVLFFLAGIALALVPITVFFVAGVLEFGAYRSQDIVIGLIVSALLVAAAAAFLAMILRKYDKPVRLLIEGIEEISRGNLSPTLPDDAPAEFGLVRDALLTMCGQMRMIISQLESLSSQVVETTTNASGSFEEVEKGAQLQADVAVSAFDRLGDLSTDLSAMSRNASEFSEKMDLSAVKVSKMDVAVGHLTEIIGSLHASIDQASRGTMSVDENSRMLAGDLTGSLAGVGSANNTLKDMMVGIKQAQADAQDAAVILGNLESEAGRISEAIENVIKGSDAAYASNDRILEVTANLQSRVDKVDDVIVVIGNLAERTKLLSINASIIASEAGEHGRAFAVVANEVKELAHSTAGAISEISKVIAGLKEGFAQTVDSIHKGQEDVEQGVRLARNAVILLGSVPEQVHQAAECNAEIVARTVNQVEKGAEVEEVFEKLGSTLGQVDQLLSEQVRRNEKSIGLFHNISITADQVMSVIKSHGKITKDTVSDVGSMSDSFKDLEERLQNAVASIENVLDLSRNIRGIISSNRDRTENLSTLISDLNRFALFLGEDFRKLE